MAVGLSWSGEGRRGRYHTGMKIIVLGAGVIGVTSAWYLTRAGHEVTLLDRQSQPGLETSRANGGQVSAGHAEPWASPSVLPRILGWLGREDAPLLFRPRADWAQWEWGLRFLRECLPGRFAKNTRDLAGLARSSRESLLALRAETGIEYDQCTRGILHFCTQPAEMEALVSHAHAMNGFGIRREIKTVPECIAIEPALSRSALPLVGGIFTPDDESGDAHKFTQRLAALAIVKGATFLPGVSVEGLETAGSRVVAARVAGGANARLEADAFVVALGSYSPLLVRPLGIPLPVYPLKGYSITVPLSAATEARSPVVSLTDEEGKLVYSRLGNRLRVAGTAELNGYDLSVNQVRCTAIVERVRTILPGVDEGAQMEYWAGLRPATPTNVPAIGRTRLENLFLNTGHGTLGWTLACGSGRALAELVSGRDPGVAFPFR